ncbi:MAG: enolase C-terminal domain-like protein [Wenzhouxiangellaceae bacterium]|nr:enolase C-terminal domain-like protein [Wenzhouxiangellaceae bacterium]
MSPAPGRTHLTLLALEARIVRLPLAEALRTGRGAYRERSIVWLSAQIDCDGTRVTGHGECAPLPGWDDDTPDAQCRALARIPLPLTLDHPNQIDAAGPDLAGRPTLRAGLELALLDALARHQSLSLAGLLAALRAAEGSGPRVAADSIALQRTLGSLPTAATVAAVEQAREDGYRAVKLKVGADPLAADQDRLTAVRERIGALELRADANGAWTVAEALQALRKLPVALIEQPVAPGHLAELLAQRPGTGTRIAADESCTGAHAAERLIDDGRIDALVIKPAALGGLLPTLALAERATAAGVQIILSNLIESAIGRAGVAALAAVLPEHPGPHGLATGGWLAHDLAERDRIEHGRLWRRDGVGIGFDPALPA